MSLRTYSLITHPSFLRHIAADLIAIERDMTEPSKELLLKEPLLFSFANPISPFGIPPTSTPEHRPYIKEIYDIGSYLGIGHDIIRHIIVHKDKHYRTFNIRKRSGGLRTIEASRTFLKIIQWWIKDVILDRCDLPDYVFGFKKGKSFVDNAKAHTNAKYILNVDIRDFFPSITTGSVEYSFRRLGYTGTVASDLAEICTFNARLPQGAPTSPMLSNLVFEDIDQIIKQASEGSGLLYTRYADDMTFSSSFPINQIFCDSIATILSSRGFSLNTKKTRFMGPNQKKEVTGLVVAKDGIALSRDYMNTLRGYFYAAKKNPKKYRGSTLRIQGLANLINQVGGRGSIKLSKLASDALSSLNKCDV